MISPLGDVMPEDFDKVLGWVKSPLPPCPTCMETPKYRFGEPQFGEPGTGAIRCKCFGVDCEIPVAMFSPETTRSVSAGLITRYMEMRAEAQAKIINADQS